MAGDFDLVARVLARKRGRAVPIRETFYLSPDPMPVFGIAPIRVVAEEQVQAVAFGTPGNTPEVLVRLNPMAREADELLPFAQALDAYLKDAIARGSIPRIWLPHRAALGVIEMLGYRYRTNRRASEPIRVMGGQCAALLAEARRPGQQVVAVAGELLRKHVATGQSPAKDYHLRALLEWIDPQQGVDPSLAADQAAIQPANAVLIRHDDDQVEDLRRRVSEGGPEAPKARALIETILRNGALQEWELLESGRQAYWGLNLIDLQGWDPESDSWRFRRIAEGRYWRPSRADGLSRSILDEQHAAEVLLDREIRFDRLIRQEARLAGRAVLCRVLEVNQPAPGQHPCHVRLETEQQVLRVRRGTSLSSLDGRLRIRVDALEYELGKPSVILAQVVKGVTRAKAPVVGETVDFIDCAPFEGHYLKRGIYQTMRDHGHPLAFGGELPSGRRRATDATKLASALDRLRGQ